jgi:hypothetical protein
MTRPVGKVQFISTDVVEFLTRAIEMLKQQGLLSTETNGTPKDFEQLAKDIDLSQFKVIVRYDFNMPCSYDMIYDKPADSWTNMSFESSMDRISTTEMILGFDYVFVGELGTTLNMSVEVYNNKGELMSRSKSVQVPFMPSKLTTVRGQFLTSIASGGVTINPGYDGEDFDMDITDVMQ